MSKYKLLRDLPGYKAGTVFTENPYWCYLSADGKTQTSCTDLAGTLNRAPHEPDWFEPLPDEPVRWRTGINHDYFVVTTSDSDSLVNASQEQGDRYDEARYKIGNYFRTKEQAQAVADAIKALLEYVHSPRAFEANRILTDKAIAAREALQPEREE